ncbi:unnamed protein product, partial [Closterium sp. Naga37s-1]
SLSGNALQGAVPPSLSNLAKLRVLDLSSNGLSGPIPNAFASLTLLTTLALGSNQLTGPLPASLFGLSNLVHLLIGGNRISSSLPDTISGLTSLLALDVSRNYFYGRLPAALGTLPSLLFLDVSENQFTGAPVSSFASPAMANTSLATLDLSGNFLSSPAASYSAKATITTNGTTTKITNSTTNSSSSSSGTNTTATLTSFCPSSLQGRYASANLLIYGISPYSSQQGNCFLGGNWNVTENFVNEKRRGNAKQGGPGGSSGGVSAKAGTTTGNTSGSSGGSASAGTGCAVGAQRRAIECVAFCGAALPAGPCGGLGTCFLSGPSNTPTCACNAGMFNVTLTLTVGKSLVSYPSCSPNPGPAPPPPPPAVDNSTMRKRDSRGANLDQAATIVSTYFNPYFRYASLGFTGNLSNPTWNITPTVDWRARVPLALQPAKDQGLCSACWIFAPVAAAEALYAIVYGAAAPSLAEQKAIDCQGTWTCAGGRPDDAFNYIAASGGLPNSSAYPYTGVANNGTCKPGFARRSVFSRRLSLNEADEAERATGTGFPTSFASLAHTLSRLLKAHTPSSNGKRTTAGYAPTAAPKKDVAAPSLPPAPFPVSMFERVGISGWLGLAIAVQQQPVVVYIEARSLSFVSYPGGFVYADPNCYATRLVDHLVVVVGFNLLDATPHWIIRNSWGPSWGENGYMKIAIAGGPGICGMNTLPGLYPSIVSPDPCKPINPCGGGVCTAEYKSSPFPFPRTRLSFLLPTPPPATPAKVCSFFAKNPCGFGTCIDDNKGGYSCLCSPGYLLGALTSGAATCIPGESSYRPATPGATSVKVTLPADMSCNQIRSTYLLSKANFTSLNPVCVDASPVVGPALAAIMDLWGAALNLNATWFVTPTCAQWQGLACNAMGQVTSLEFTGRRQLVGQSIPAAITQLGALQRLTLDRNLLVGSVPPNIGYLSALTNLSMGGNALQGSIPAGISTLVSLRVLDLHENYLTGAIPDSFAPLSSLATLVLGNNRLSGSLPASLIAQSALQNILIGGNAIASVLPESISAWSSLLALDISRNKFYGRMPAALGSFTALVHLYVPPHTATAHRCPPLLTTLCLFLPLPAASIHTQQDPDSLLNPPFFPSFSFSTPQLSPSFLSLPSSSSRPSLPRPPLPAETRSIECVAFCGAALPAGPCGGLGTCFLSGPSNTPTCACNAGMFNVLLSIQVGKEKVSYPSCSPNQGPAPPPPPPPPDANTWRRREFRGADLDDTAVARGSYFNPYFRYASLGFIGNYTSPKWNITPTVDWRTRVPTALAPAKDQGLCAACWIFAPVAAAEALYAIVYGAAAPSLAEQKAIDCQGTWSCAGGRPDDAFNYIAASGGLPNSSAYPFTGVPNNSTCRVTRKRLLSVNPTRRLLSDLFNSGNTNTNANGNAATNGNVNPNSAVVRNTFSHTLDRLLLPSFWSGPAAKAPPAASVPMPNSAYSVSMFERVGISGWLGLAIAVQQQPVVVYIEARADTFMNYTGGYVYADPNCYATRLVDHLVVVVGFNLLDATPHWIIRNSWGPSWGESGYMKIAIAGGPGICGMNTLPGLYPSIVSPDPCKPINPCGGGVCTAVTGNKNQRNKCTCPTNFVAVTNLDWTQSCALAKVCAFFAMNPCGFGTCIDDNKGGYSCLCSPGYSLGQRTDGSATCIPGGATANVTLQAAMTCSQIRSTYMLSRSMFIQLNPKLKCAGTFPPGTVIVTRNTNQTSANVTGCIIPYTVAQGDSCTTIMTMFNVTLAQLNVTNPDLDCGILAVGQQICISSGTPQAQSCLNFYTVNPGESCNDVMINTYPPITPAQLYQYNPGIICTADTSQRLVGQEVCVDATIVGAVKCSYGVYTVVRGDTCASVVCKVFKCSYSTMYAYNAGFKCTTSTLYVGKALCKPKP